MANLIGGIVGLTLGVILVSTVLFPTAKNTNTSGWSSSEVAMFGLVTLGSVIGLAYGAFSLFGVM